MYRLTGSSSSGESGLPPFWEYGGGIEKAFEVTVRVLFGDIRTDTVARPSGRPPDEGRTTARGNRHTAQIYIPKSMYHLVFHR